MNLIERLSVAIGTALFGRSHVLAELIPSWELNQGSNNPDPEGAFLQSYRRVQWVYSCVYAITSFAAMCPLRLYHLKPGDDPDEKEPCEYNHPAYELVRRPNEQTVQYRFIERLVGFMELGNGGFIYKEDGREDAPTEYHGPPKSLYVIRPDRISKIIPDENGLIAAFQVGHGADAPKYPFEKICYIPYFNPYDDYWSQSSVQAIQQSIISDVEAQNYNANYLKNWAIPATLLVSKVKLTEPQRKIFLQTWDKAFKGSAKRGKTGLVDQDITVHKLADSMKDMDFAGLRTMSREEILAAFGVPKGLLGLDVANRSVVEMQERQFAYRTMIPKLTYIAQCMTAYIFRDFSEDLYAEFDLSSVPALREDSTEKANRAVALVNAGIWTRNEARQKEYGFDAVPGGDDLLVPMTLIPIGSAGTMSPMAGGEKSRALPIYTLKQEKRLLMYERRFTATENAAKRMLRAMFDEQAKEAKKALRRSYESRDIEDIIDDAFLAQSSEKTVRAVLLAAIEQGILHGKEPFELIELDFTLENPRLVAWLEKESMKQVKLVNDTTKAMLKTAQKEMAEKIAEGAPLKEVEAVIDKAFKHRKNNAATIARTEVQQGIQNTQEIMWQETPVVTGKTWLASFHPEGRHNLMHNQTVRTNESFVQVEGPNTGATAPHPGGFGIAGEDINCLCDMAPEVNMQAMIYGKIDDMEKRLYPAEGKGSRSWEKQEKIRQLLGAR